MDFLFILIADEKYGYGHLKRCLTLADELKKQKHQSYFNIISHSKFNLKKIPYNVNLCSLNKLSFNNYLLKKKLRKKKIVIVDISHPDILKKNILLEKLFNNFLINNFRIIVIDTFEKINFQKKLNSIDVSLYIIPYYYNKKNIRADINTIFGKKFVIFDDSYYSSSRKIRKINYIAKKIIVTCGGSDKSKLILKILNSLNKINISLEIKIIIGIFFSKDYYEKLVFFKNNTHHKIKFINQPDSLYRYMLWSDFAISTSGLTKYELAFTGTPAALISIDKLHHFANKNFKILKTSLDLGYKFNSKKFINIIQNILFDFKKRKALSENGYKHFDFMGKKRIIDEIIKKVR